MCKQPHTTAFEIGACTTLMIDASHLVAGEEWRAGRSSGAALILGYPVIGKAGEKVESARRIEQSGTVIVQRGKGNDDGGTLWKGA
jgi:hypothetical protein